MTSGWPPLVTTRHLEKIVHLAKGKAKAKVKEKVKDWRKETGRASTG